MPEAPVIQQHADPTEPKMSLSVKILKKIANFGSKILQTAHFLNHVTSYPGCDLPSRGVQKGTPFGPRLQNEPILGPCHTRSRVRFTIQRGPKTGFPNIFAFGGPRFGTRFAQILTQFASKHGPRSKIHFLDHVTRFPQYVLPSEGGPISTFFYLGSLFGHLRMVKHTEEIVYNMVQKVVPIQKVPCGRWDGHEKFWFSWGRL